MHVVIDVSLTVFPWTFVIIIMVKSTRRTVKVKIEIKL